MPIAEIENLIMMIAVVIVSGKKALPTQEFYIDTENGETGRYYVSSDNYLCHYGSPYMLSDPTFSTQCFKQNKDNLSSLEFNSNRFPYFDPSVDDPPVCGPLPIVNDGKWECPDGVSPLSVPVYESCRLLSKGDCTDTGLCQIVRCTEKLELKMVFVEKSSGCGPLPIVNDGKWECPDGVSPLSVPVNESCRILSKGDYVQIVRCTDKLELEMVFVEKVPVNIDKTRIF